MANYIMERAAPKEAPGLHTAKRRSQALPAALSAVTRRRPAGTQPSVHILREVQDVIESVLGASVAPDTPLMQVLLSSRSALASCVQYYPF